MVLNLSEPAHEAPNPQRGGFHILVSGASGLIGTVLVSRLRAKGHQVTTLVRRAPRLGEIPWDPVTGRLESRDLAGANSVVHLAGENIGTRWTPGRKDRIRRSRVSGTFLLSTTLARLEAKPRVLVSASAVGIYGDRGNEILTEASSTGDPADFLVSVCREWEAAADPARAAGIRVVHPRFGVVLSPEGGALKRLLPPFRLGIGGTLGRGTQWMSWITIDDAVAVICHAITATGLEGPVNATAPAPVTNASFTKALARVLGRPAALPIPAAALKLVFGEMAEHTLLGSARIVPKRLLESGFQFAYPELEPALRHLLRARTSGK